VLVSAVLIAAISEVARRSSLLGAVLASIPLVSVLAMLWLYYDTRDSRQVAQLSYGVFWMVLPSLVLFILLPLLLRWQLAFIPALLLSLSATVLAYFAMLRALGLIGIAL
jgi:hypothetical protein